MIKSILTLVAVSSLVAAPAFAKTLKVPSDEFPIASITMPNDWEPEEINNGVAGESPDKAVYLAAVAVGSEKGMNSELDDTFEFLKEHKRVEAQQSKIEEQEATIAELKSRAARQQKGMDVLTAQLKEQTAQIQKVSTQVQISRSATKVTFNNP